MEMFDYMKQQVQELQEAMKEHGNHQGYAIDFGRVTIDTQTGEATYQVRMLPNPDFNNPEKVLFEHGLRLLGASHYADAFGKQVVLNSQKLTVYGINPRARKYPVLVRNDQTGTSYKVPLEFLDQAE